MRVVLTIAGSDSSGGAGLQADLKTMTVFGVYGATAVTAITAQNTVGVQSVFPLPSQLVTEQIRSVFGDVDVHAVKTGMLHNMSIIEAVAQELAQHQMEHVVVDPVMISQTGAMLLEPDAVQALKELLFPMAGVVTPNTYEAEQLAGFSIRSPEDRKKAAQVISEFGPRAVVVKGGHGSEDATDVLYDGREFHEFAGKRVADVGTHGSGCTFASAIASCLALGRSLSQSTALAKEFVREGITPSTDVGAGNSPVNHLHMIDSEKTLAALEQRLGHTL
jgi:hydroxymethylpyrimidine/phosphomethylpyrimidine kinase